MWVAGGQDGITWTEVTTSAAFSARENHASLVFDGKMWVTGGFQENSPGRRGKDTGNGCGSKMVGGYSGSASYAHVLMSSDGVSWTTSSAAFGKR
jgi:hypothetical protein